VHQLDFDWIEIKGSDSGKVGLWNHGLLLFCQEKIAECKEINVVLTSRLTGLKYRSFNPTEH
jgi:hypothetical protein